MHASGVMTHVNGLHLLRNACDLDSALEGSVRILCSFIDDCIYYVKWSVANRDFDVPRISDTGELGEDMTQQ